MASREYIPGQSRKKRPSGKKPMKESGFYTSTAWRNIREQVLRRDNYECQACKKKHPKEKPKRAREVHHIKPLEEFPELALTMSNLVSLCHDCHEETKNRKSTFTPPGVRVIKVSDGSDD